MNLKIGWFHNLLFWLIITLGWSSPFRKLYFSKTKKSWRHIRGMDTHHIMNALDNLKYENVSGYAVPKMKFIHHFELYQLRTALNFELYRRKYFVSAKNKFTSSRA